MNENRMFCECVKFYELCQKLRKISEIYTEKIVQITKML